MGLYMLHFSAVKAQKGNPDMILEHLTAAGIASSHIKEFSRNISIGIYVDPRNPERILLFAKMRRGALPGDEQGGELL